MDNKTRIVILGGGFAGTRMRSTNSAAETSKSWWKLACSALRATPLSYPTARNWSLVRSFGRQVNRHLQIALDDAPRHWTDASGNPVDVGGLPPGQHRIRITLVDANG